MNNSKMERMNGELEIGKRSREGLRKWIQVSSPATNFIITTREHESLKDKTPAEVAGIKIEGVNKWVTVIQNAHLMKNNTFRQNFNTFCITTFLWLTWAQVYL